MSQQSDREERRLLQVATRRASDRGERLQLSDDEKDPGYYHRVAKAVHVPSLSEAVLPLLLLVRARSGTKHEAVYISLDHDYPAVGFAHPEPLPRLLRDLSGRKLLGIENKRAPTNWVCAHYALTLAGDEYLAGLVKQARGLTGWERVDRQLAQAEGDLRTATTEERCQAIGHLCRETLISLAQAVYKPERHALPDGKVTSAADAARMLQGYLGAELAGGPNEEARKLAKAAESFTDALTHKRSAKFRDAALCLEATRSLVEMVAILERKRG